eukprot:NODE_31_length_32452_cov_0.352672.p22 type:complete len:132 gc:universal NODE_31_length_32452_cov_0.352672:5426-5031(-)
MHPITLFMSSSCSCSFNSSILIHLYNMISMIATPFSIVMSIIPSNLFNPFILMAFIIASMCSISTLFPWFSTYSQQRNSMLLLPMFSNSNKPRVCTSISSIGYSEFCWSLIVIALMFMYMTAYSGALIDIL